MIHNLDDLPFPARDHLPQIMKMGGEVLISASRGCFYRCTFCSIPDFFDHSWRSRSPANVVQELKHLVSTYGYSTFWFIDDDFFAPWT